MIFHTQQKTPFFFSGGGGGIAIVGLKKRVFFFDLIVGMKKNGFVEQKWIVGILDRKLTFL